MSDTYYVQIPLMLNMLNWKQAKSMRLPPGLYNFVKSLNMLSIVELNLFELHVTVSLKVDAI